jgi:hypothetical protein
VQRDAHPFVSLQHQVGNRAVQRLVASASEGPKDDRTFRNTTLTAHTKVGGKIKPLSATDFSKDFGSVGEGLAITAHGKINVVGDYSATDLAAHLVHPDTGLQDGSHDIDLESCYAAVPGKPEGDQEPTSVISTVKGALTKRASEASWDRVPLVTGSSGPPITTRVPKGGDEGGFDIVKTVIDPKYLSIAGPIQNILRAAITDVSEKVDLNFGREGRDFVEEAESDEVAVRTLKQAFIQIASGRPGDVRTDLMATIKEKAESFLEAKHIKLIFETGVDLRAPKESVTI